MRRTFVLAAASVCALGLVVGCQSKSSGAAEYFGHEYSCPEGSVTVKERADVRPSTVFLYPFQAKPSPEVASDPARLAKFNADEKASREKYDGFTDSQKEIFEVSGCGHAVTVGCSRSSKRNTVSCEEPRKR